MSAPSYRSRWPVYAKQWDAMQRSRLSDAQDAAERILSHKARYQEVEAKTGVPWYWIGPTHYRESDLDFSTQLAQGDPLNKVSSHIPRGQGPYYGADAWERAALIALEDHGLDKVIDWRLEKLLYWWESYNGWGYFNHGTPSAYVWAGTDQYTGGMYVADGVWSATAKDRRVGCAAILKCLAEMDKTILLVRETDDLVPPMPQPQPFPKPEPAPVPTPQPQQPDLVEVLTTLTQVVVALAKKVEQSPQAKSSISQLLGLVVSSLPQLGVWGIVISILLNAFGLLGSAPMAGPENAVATSAFAASGGALLSGLLNLFKPKEPAK